MSVPRIMTEAFRDLVKAAYIRGAVDHVPSVTNGTTAGVAALSDKAEKYALSIFPPDPPEGG